MPKVSVIMGIYNTLKKEFLEESINSILNQTFTDFEFIICDDGSTNECFLWAEELCKNDKRCKLIKNEQNMGLSYTLNRCLENASGEYIARMDDDDIAEKTRLEKQVSFLDNNNEYGVVASNANLFDDKGIYGELVYPEIIKKESFLFGNPIVHPSVLVRKNAYDMVGGYRDLRITNRVEDYDLFMRMFAINIKIYVIQEKILNYRQDSYSFQKRKFKYRINECIIRATGFYRLKLYPKAMIFVVKPIIVGMIPKNILMKIKKAEK